MRHGLYIILGLLLVIQSAVYAAPMVCVDAAEQTPCHEMATVVAVVDLDCDHCQDCVMPHSTSATGLEPGLSPGAGSHDRPAVAGSYLSPGEDIFHPPISAEA